MSTVYTVRSGDWLDKIARNHGFDSWRDLYYHPDNAAFRAKRPNPNLIYPGDQIVIPDVVLAVTAEGATEIPADGNPAITHFVAPRLADRVTLTATLALDTPGIRGRINWEGAIPVPGNPLQAVVPRHLPARHVVKVKVGTRVEKELRVWVVWANVTATDIPIDYDEPVNLAGAGLGGFITGGFNFRHQIMPGAIVTDADRPNLRGLNVSAPPGGNHPLSGDPLSGGADKKWDNSRQIRAKILNPAGLLNSAFAQPAPVAVAAYPVNDVEGNDDRATGDEFDNGDTDNPYVSGGVLHGSDSPGMGIDNNAGKDGDTWERRLHFREFARLELDGTWHRISDFFPWRIHVKFRKAGGKWIDDGTDKALDNAGF